MPNKETIEPDKALISIGKDALGVADLARRIASSVVRMNANHGLVIALCGAWGSGKTTFINFTKEVLSTYPEEDQPIILDFNPWLFSGQEDLVQRYIIELSRALAPKRHKLREWRRNAAQGIEELTAVSQGLLVFAASLSAVPMVASSVKALSSLSQRAVKKLSEQPPLSEQKEKIGTLLARSKRKVLVIIDDIDRLEIREMLDIFRMVKSVADFPNVIYLLSYDKGLVSNIVAEFQNTNGKDYLEKIVQYDIDLPYPNPSGVLRLFGEQVDPIIEEEGGKIWDADRWSNFYSDYLRNELKTPRRALRLGSAFNIAYSGLKGEVAPVDFLAIESLRMFHPVISNEIRRNPHRFTELGQSEIDTSKTDPPYFRRVLDLIKEDDRIAVQKCLELLFPRVENALNSFSKATVDDIPEWRAQARICSSKHFERYFSYSILSDHFSDAEIKEAIRITSNVESFEAQVVGYSKQVSRSGKSRIPDFLEGFLDTVRSGQADEHLSDAIKSLIIVGDLIVREEDDDRSGFLNVETDLRVQWIVYSALRRIAEEDIFKTIKEAFEKTKSIHVPTRLLFHFGREHGLYNKEKKEILREGGKPYLLIEQVKELEKIILSKIEAATKDGSLLENVKLAYILHRWRDITGNVDAPKAWAKKISSSDTNLKKFISRFARVSTITTGRKTVEETYVRADQVGMFIDLDSIVDRIKNFLSDDSISEKERIVFQSFLKSYENYKNGIHNDED